MPAGYFEGKEILLTGSASILLTSRARATPLAGRGEKYL